MKPFLALALGAILTGCYANTPGSVVPTIAMNANHSHTSTAGLSCHDHSQYIPESQLFIQGPSGDYDAVVRITPNNNSYRFYSVTVQNKLYPSPIIVSDDVDGPSQYKFIQPSSTQSWTLPQAKVIYVQQSLDDLASGGVQVDATSCIQQ